MIHRVNRSAVTSNVVCASGGSHFDMLIEKCGDNIKLSINKDQIDYIRGLALRPIKVTGRRSFKLLAPRHISGKFPDSIGFAGKLPARVLSSPQNLRVGRTGKSKPLCT